jgi:hypothetical protein
VDKIAGEYARNCRRTFLGYRYRPFQYDSRFKPILVETPDFPGYPAGHTTVTGALALVLSHLFPKDTAHFQALAEECSESRFEGGVHFRTDNEVGLEVGKNVGIQVIKGFYKLFYKQ